MELGVKFRSDVAGAVQGIRFYKGKANTGVHTGSLWSTGGQLLAQATFTGETLSGWQQIFFSAPVTITANTLYVASYHTQVGRYSVNRNYFATTGRDSGPLHAPVSSSVSGNGVYKYGVIGLPTVNRKDSNYWVDVVFIPSTGTTVPNAPTGLTAIPGNAKVSLSWTASSGATDYKVYRSGTSGGPYVLQGSSTAAAFTDTAVSNGTTYYYVVSATNSAGDSSFSNQAAATPTASTTVPDLGANASLHGWVPFPSDNPWNTPIDTAPVDPNSATLISSIGLSTGLHPDFGSGAGWTGVPFGIPYVVVPGTQPRVPVSFDYADESDPGPYPIPPDAPIEGGSASDGDRHVLVVDRDNWKLWELFYAFPNGSGWTAGSGATFDLNSDALRPAGWTSADAAGLPVFPGLVRYDEVVEQGAIRHALRFTVSQSRHAYVSPARHYASSNTSASLPPMGMRVRLKASFDISNYPPAARVILQALKTYGMFVADNGSNWYISGAPDARWNDDDLNALKQVTGNNFEVVKMGTIYTQ